MTRNQRILTLLEHLEDYEPQLGTGVAGTSGVIQMPPIWHHPSVQELIATLGRLHVADPIASTHVNLYYRAEWKTVDTTRRTKTRKGIKTIPGPRTRQRIIPRHLDLTAKNRGVEWILDNYPGEPFLPDELREELVSTG